MADIKKLAEELTSLSVLEVKELKDLLKEEYGLEAAAPVAVAAVGGAAPAAGGAAEGAEEKSSYDVVLEGFGDNKIGVIKAIREITGLGLKEAKDAVEGAPKAVLEGVDKAKAEEAEAKIKEAGGAVTLK